MKLCYGREENSDRTDRIHNQRPQELWKSGDLLALGRNTQYSKPLPVAEAQKEDTSFMLNGDNAEDSI